MTHPSFTQRLREHNQLFEDIAEIGYPYKQV